MTTRTRRNWIRKKSKVYGDRRWKSLRKKLLGGLCDMCGLLLATHLHHKVTPFTPSGIDERLAFSESNLQPLCETCHMEHHKKERTKKSNRCDHCQTELVDGECHFCKEYGYGSYQQS